MKFIFVDCNKAHQELLFFSSRRRHTRFSRDWSSDVCSSDLLDQGDPRRPLAQLPERSYVAQSFGRRLPNGAHEDQPPRGPRLLEGFDGALEALRRVQEPGTQEQAPVRLDTE